MQRVQGRVKYSKIIITGLMQIWQYRFFTTKLELIAELATLSKFDEF